MLESLNEVNLAGKEQHGFTKGKSTATAGLVLQSLIARALDDDQLVLINTRSFDVCTPMEA